MANVRVANASLQAMGDAIVDLIDGGAGAGTINIYSGTQPADGDASITGTLLATLTFSDPAFGATSTGGVATASAITDDSSAAEAGTATHAVILDSNSARIFDCDVGTSGATINLNSTSITSGGTVSISSFTVTHPDGV